MSSSNFNNSKLRDLDIKLKNIREKDQKTNYENHAIKSAHIGWRMIIELVIGILIGVILGFTMDSFFNTSPIFLIIMIFFGFAAGIKTMMKTAKEIDKKNNLE